MQGRVGKKHENGSFLCAQILPHSLTMRFHASCAALQHQPGADALLILGPSGAGKSDLLFRLIDRGFALVADDQVIIEDGLARPPETLAGLIEVRGLGLFYLPFIAPARLRLVVSLGPALATRLPEPQMHSTLHVPEIIIDPKAPSAVARVALALEAACGRVVQHAGAFAA